MPASADQWARRRELVIALVLAMGTVCVYAAVAGHEFVRFDDQAYIVDNEQIKAGLTAENLRWFWTASVAANWHPLTVFSHMVDCELFGLHAGWHHGVNLTWHVVNTVLLFWVLSRMTGDVWPSALVAAIFAWHPLHVESVAWVSERKDVLSTFFWFAAMGLYWRYTVATSAARYVLVMIAMAFGLAAKPMLVTLPCVLLLLDWWPLARLEPNISAGKTVWRRAAGLAAEKLPLFGLTLLAAMATFVYQQQAGAMSDLGHIPLDARLQNAFVSYTRYVGQMAWPVGLSPYYPFPGGYYDLAEWGGAALGLILVTAIALFFARRLPYILVGWLWYLGTLVPVIGIVQVGGQAHADRYTYVPLVGLSIILAWGLRDLVRAFPGWRIPVATAVSAWLVVLALLCWRQVAVWRDSESLFAHALVVSDADGRNWVAHLGYGDVLSNREEYADAIAHYRVSLAANPSYEQTHFQLANALLASDQVREAAQYYAQVVELARDEQKLVAAHNNLARCLLRLDRWDEAKGHFQAALELDPANRTVILGLVELHLRQRNTAEAVAVLQGALERGLNDFRLFERLARIYATSPDPQWRNADKAVALAEQACRMNDFSEVASLDTLSTAYAAAGRFDAALDAATQALTRLRDIKEPDERIRKLSDSITQHISRYQLRQAIYEDVPTH